MEPIRTTWCLALLSFGCAVNMISYFNPPPPSLPRAPQEEALKREGEEAKRYRLRLVPRASSVTCRSMIVSLPAFLVAAARGARR